MAMGAQFTFSCFIQSRMQALGMMLLTFEGGLPTSGKPIYKLPDRHSHESVSMVILNHSKLIININGDKSSLVSLITKPLNYKKC